MCGDMEGEVEAFGVVAAGGEDECVDTDDVAGGVEEGAAAVPGVHGCIGLEVADVFAGAFGGNDAGGEGGGTAEAGGDDGGFEGVAPGPGGVAEGGRVFGGGE